MHTKESKRAQKQARILPASPKEFNELNGGLAGLKKKNGVRVKVGRPEKT